MHWCADSKHVVSAAHDGKLVVWDAQTGHKVHAIPLKSNWVMACAYAPSGNFVAYGGLNNTTYAYNLGADPERCPSNPFPIHRELHGHSAVITGCRFIDDAQIITASGDQTCCLWDVERGQRISTFTGTVEKLGDVSNLWLAMDAILSLSALCGPLFSCVPCYSFYLFVFRAQVIPGT